MVKKIRRITPLESLERFTFDLQRFATSVWDGPTVASSFSNVNTSNKTITINYNYQLSGGIGSSSTGAPKL